MRQHVCESMIDEIGVQREGALELGDRGFVLYLEQQNPSKMGMSLGELPSSRSVLPAR